MTREPYPQFRFEECVVAPENEAAYTAALRVAESPGRADSPLVICSDVGVGKTHLLHAIGNRVRSALPNLRVLAVTSERFITEVVHAIRHDAADALRAAYGAVDLLLLDGVQCLAGKPLSQGELCGILSALSARSRQVVVSSDGPPEQIPDVIDELRAALNAGRTVHIQPPSVETKAAILSRKARARGITLPEDAAYRIAAGGESNVRMLEHDLGPWAATGRESGW